VNKSIAEVTAGGEQEFLASRLIQDGGVRNLEVIGEATKTSALSCETPTVQFPGDKLQAGVMCSFKTSSK
tara:strand:+ start:334 stop:543 length:210 start_codon:yes stop_codon:yes gene_type:complete